MIIIALALMSARVVARKNRKSVYEVACNPRTKRCIRKLDSARPESGSNFVISTPKGTQTSSPTNLSGRFPASKREPLPFLERPVSRSFSALTRSSRVAASIIGPIIDCACPSLPDDRLPWIRYRFLSGYGPNYGLVCRSNRGDIYDI